MKEINSYFSISFVSSLIRNVSAFFFSIFFIEIGLGGFESGFLLAIGTLTGILFSFHFGIKSDQVKQRKLILVAIITIIIHLVLLIFFDNYWILVVSFLFSGIGYNLIKRTSDSLIYKSSTKHGIEMAIYEFVKVFPFLIGIILGGYLIQYFGFKEVFILSLVLCLFTLIYVSRIKSQKTYTFTVSHYIQDLKNKKVLYFCFAVFFFALHFGAELSAYSPFLIKNLGLTITQSAYFMAGVVIPLMLSSFFIGRLIDNKKARKVKILAYSALVSGIGGILFALTDNVWWSFFFRCIHEIGDGAFLVSISIGILSLFDKKRVGGNAGFISLVTIISTSIGALISSPLGYKFGFQMPHIVMSAFSVIAFFMILGFDKKQ